MKHGKSVSDNRKKQPRASQEAHPHTPAGANIAGVPIEEPYTLGNDIPATDGNGEYIPRHLAEDDRQRSARYPRNSADGEYLPQSDRSSVPYDDTFIQRNGNADDRGEYLPQPDGSHIAPNGAVIRNPWSEQPEIVPDNEYTPEKEDLNLMIL